MIKDKGKTRKAEIPTSSLADIAFLLLTFFLVTTTIDIDKGIGLTLPDPKGEQKQIRKENITNLLINESGQVLLDLREVSVPQIKEIISEKIRQRPQLIVSLKTDRNTPYNVYVQVIDQLKLANARRISLAEPEK
ncbi:biopolymer transporter ExbD [candidate division KSB1 bacterium]|nr:biopolymer transporter ExbD [candidate division KSB1 bacterium]